MRVTEISTKSICLEAFDVYSERVISGCKGECVQFIGWITTIPCITAIEQSNISLINHKRCHHCLCCRLPSTDYKWGEGKLIIWESLIYGRESDLSWYHSDEYWGLCRDTIGFHCVQTSQVWKNYVKIMPEVWGANWKARASICVDKNPLCMFIRVDHLTKNTM